MSVITITPTIFLDPSLKLFPKIHFLTQTEMPITTLFLGLFLLKISLVFLCSKDPNQNVKSPNLKGVILIKNSYCIELETSGGLAMSLNLHVNICVLSTCSKEEIKETQARIPIRE